MNFENKLIIDIVKSRALKIFDISLFSVPQEEREMVQFNCTDISFTFKPLLHTFFKNATLLVDRFYVTKSINDQLTDTRKNTIYCSQFSSSIYYNYDYYIIKMKPTILFG